MSEEEPLYRSPWVDFIPGGRMNPTPATQVHGVSKSETPETDAAVRPIPAIAWQNYGDSTPETVLADFARSLERRLTDTRKLLAQYSAEREHNAMLALRYEAVIRDALLSLRNTYDIEGWSMADSDAARILESALTP